MNKSISQRIDSSFLDHDLSPLPLIIVFVGYWLPIEWLLHANTTMNTHTTIEKIFILGSSITLNYFAIAIYLSIFLYTVGLTHKFFQKTYRHMIKFEMIFASNFVCFIVTSFSIKSVYYPETSIGLYIKLMILLVFLCSAGAVVSIFFCKFVPV